MPSLPLKKPVRPFPPTASRTIMQSPGRGTVAQTYVTREEAPVVQLHPRWLPPARYVLAAIVLAIVTIVAAGIANAQVNEVPGSPGPITQAPGTPGPGAPRAQLVLRADGLTLYFGDREKVAIAEDGTIEFSDAATIDFSPAMVTSNSGYFHSWIWVKVGGHYRLLPSFNPPDASGTQRPVGGQP